MSRSEDFNFSTSMPLRSSMMKRDRRRLEGERTRELIPKILASNRRALAGTASSHLIVSARARPTGPETNSFPIRLVSCDSFTAARNLQLAHLGKNGEPTEKVAVLNMASPYKPGGGFMTGALAQEESLCMRSTLFRCIATERHGRRFHPLPALGPSLIYTTDVFVFRDEDGKELKGKDAFYVNVISSAMPKSPKTTPDKKKYESNEIRKLVKQKMRLVMRVACEKGVKRLVLGAWGAGAYNNPLEEIVAAWKEVLSGGTTKEQWEGIEEVVFAVLDSNGNNMFRRFANEWGQGLDVLDS